MNVFDLAAKITLDDKEYNSKLDGAFGKLQSVGSKIGSGLATAAKVGAAAVGVAATAVGGLAMKSVQAYSEYEQMVGGVNKLYGNMGMSLEDYAKSQGKTAAEVKTQWETLGKAQDMVLKNAQNAYKTAGMSANQYMGIATSFSAALINSLNGDTVKAAEATDKAMTAIADNWNTFGGDIGMIQGAFQGFAKQNYTMLDNLKLGYGGTQKEMQRLIADANEYAKSIGQASNLSIKSFADIVTAIDLIQQKQQIAGTTAREASTTIQGSLGMVKAAWENLMIGMSDSNANLDQMMNNLVDSIAGYTDKTGQHVNGLIDNVLPVVEKALASVSTLIEKLAPKIAEELPKLINTVLPSLLSAGGQIVTALGKGLVDNLPVLLTYVQGLLNNLLQAMTDFDFSSATSNMIDSLSNIGDKLDDIWEIGLAIVNELFRGITEATPVLMEAGTNIIISLANDLIDELPTFIETGFTLLSNIAEGITSALPDLAAKAVEIIQTVGQGIVENLPMLIDAAVDLITTIGETLTDPTNLQMLLETGMAILETIVQSIIDNLPTLIEAALQIILNLVEYISENLDTVVQAAIDIIMAIAQALLENLPLLISAAIDIVVALASALIENIPTVVGAVLKIIEGIITTLINSLPKMMENGMKIVESIIGGIIKMLGSVIEMGIGLVDKFIDGIVGAGPRIIQAGKDMVGKLGESVLNVIEDAKKWGRDLIDNFVGGIKEKIEKVKETVGNVAQTVKDILGFSEPEEGPLSNFHTYAPDMMNLFIKGIKDNEKRLQDQVAKSFDFGDITMKTTPTVSAKGENAGTNNMTINVYGAEGQDVRELADIVQDRILHMMNQTGAVYA